MGDAVTGAVEWARRELPSLVKWFIVTALIRTINRFEPRVSSSAFRSGIGLVKERDMIDLYYWPTPNGKKVAILLEETGLPYRIVPLDIGSGAQFSPQYLALNPNHRMPAIVDNEPLGGGAPISVFESGAILLYIAEKAGRFWPQTPREKYEVAQWVMWQMANQGPKFGESGHFRRASQRPENGDMAYALRRFDDEVNRLFGVMNYRLYDRRYLAGADYSVADIICYPWSLNWQTLGQDLAEFKHVERWLEDVGSRAAVRRGMDVGKELAVDFSKLPKEELDRRMKILSNQRALPAPGKEDVHP